MKTYSDYRQKAKEAFDSFYNSEYRVIPADNDIDHICGIATSIMMTRDGVLSGGSFVIAVVENNLESAISRADSVCVQNLPFFVYCKRFIHLK